MKVRIGVAAGPGSVPDRRQFLALVDALDDLGYDSLWIPDVVTTPSPDPITALSVAAGRRDRLKLGTHLILPGRNPVFLAKQLATLDQFSDGRLLLLAVLGLREPDELDAQGVDARERTTMLEESLDIIRRLWRGESVHHNSEHYRYEGARLNTLPLQDPLEVWLGGMVPAALARCGRVGDGWMPGMCTPAEAAEARAVIDTAAAEAGRIIDREHYGVNVSWVPDQIDDQTRAMVARRRPDLKAEDVIGVGVGGLTDRLNGFVDVGFSKFVIRPATPPTSWTDAVAGVADILELQN